LSKQRIQIIKKLLLNTVEPRNSREMQFFWTYRGFDLLRFSSYQGFKKKIRLKEFLKCMYVLKFLSSNCQSVLALGIAGLWALAFRILKLTLIFKYQCVHGIKMII
jgi:hypothetical protein